MIKQEVITTLKAMGWQEDRHGNFKSASGKVRCKLQANSLRVEKQYIPEPLYGYKPENQWLNMASDYYKNLYTKDGRLVVKGKILRCQALQEAQHPVAAKVTSCGA